MVKRIMTLENAAEEQRRRIKDQEDAKAADLFKPVAFAAMLRGNKKRLDKLKDAKND